MERSFCVIMMKGSLFVWVLSLTSLTESLLSCGIVCRGKRVELLDVYMGR